MVHSGVVIAGAGPRCGEDVLQTSRGVLQPPDLALHPVMTCSLSCYIDGQQRLAWWLVASSGERITTFTLTFCLLTRLQTEARGAMHSWRRYPARPDGDIRPEAILSTSFGGLRTAMYRQVTCTCQIWIPGWILPHFDVRTISVASKLKKLQIFLYY